MPTAPGQLRRRRRRAALAAALACGAGALALPACGGDGEQSAESSDTAAVRADDEQTTAQPPPETAPEGVDPGESDEASARSAREAAESAVATGAESEAVACPDVVIAPDSGNGLFEVEAEGITCEDAGAALAAWGRSGYPGEGPPGFTCSELTGAADGASRLRCEQQASGGVVEFETGV